MCDQCDEAFILKQDLTKHVARVHRDSSKPAKTLMCEECSFTTTFKSNLVKHRKKIHLGIIERHPCDQCEKVLTSKGNLDVHRKRKHEPKEFRVFSFPCDLCSAGFVTKADRKTHILSRHGKREPGTLICDKCPYTTPFKNSKTLARHKKKYHDAPTDAGGRFSSDDGDFVGKFEGAVVRHKAQSGGYISSPDRLVCSHCPFIAISLVELKKHTILEHNSHQLVMDDKVHQLFPCNQCEYVAPYKAHLKNHMDKLHSLQNIQEDLIKCDECDYVTTTFQSLAAHRNSVHRNSKYSCDICQYQTHGLEDLQTHKRSEHLDADDNVVPKMELDSYV